MFRSDPFPFCPRLLLPSLYMQKSHADCEFSSSSARKCNASGGHLMAGLRGWSHWGGGWPGNKGVRPAQPSCVQSTSSTANATFCFPAINFDHALNPLCSGQTLPPQPPLLSLLSHGFFIRTFLEKSVGQELEQGQGGRRDDESIRRVASFCGRGRNSHMMSHYAIYWRLTELSSPR